MLANIGAVTVFAENYSGGSHIYVGDLSVGDVVEVGAVLHSAGNAQKNQGYKSFYVCFGEVKVNSSDHEYKFDRRAMLVATEDDKNNAERLILRFEDIDTAGEADSEAKLRAYLSSTDKILLSGDIELTAPLEIDDGGKHTINMNGHSITRNLSGGSGKGSVIRVTNRSTLTIRDTSPEGSAVITGGNENEGGGIFVDGKSTLNLHNIAVTSNLAKYGGGICVKSGTAEISRCTIDNNTVGYSGGGLYLGKDAVVTITECTIENNEARDGGAVYSTGSLTVDSCTLTGNSASDSGAGIWTNGVARLTNTEISQNINAVNGGGIANYYDMILRECTVNANNASKCGGGVYNDKTDGTYYFENCTISDNTAQTGAGIFLNSGDVEITKTTMENNVAAKAGGALWANTNTLVSFTDSVLQNNSCKTNGGGINSHGTLRLTGSTVNACAAENCGGGVYLDSGKELTVESSEITNCTSIKGGGGLYLYAGSLVLAGGKTRIADNTTDGSADNTRFRNYKKIQITGTFGEGSEIGLVPPSNSENANVTADYGTYNDTQPASIFRCDTNEYTINPDEACTEVNLLHKVHASFDGYHVKVNIRVTDDADWWDYAYLQIFARGDKGRGEEKLVNKTDDIQDAIDDDDEEFTYEYDCGADEFPSAVNVQTSFGTWGSWRGFEADVKVYINDINCASQHIVHEVYGDEEKNTRVEIGGNKYPYPAEFDVDMPQEIKWSGTITITAVDQYGLAWNTIGNNASMQNISFPEEDTFEAADDSGLKWKLSSTHQTNHMSTYELTFLSGSDVYPEITKAINAQFTFPLSLTVVVDGKEVFSQDGFEGDTVTIPALEAPPGYTLNGFEKATGGILTKKDANNYVFTFVSESVTLTAKLKANMYKIVFEKNGTGPDSADVINRMSNKMAYYDKSYQLADNKFKRQGYEFIGWNTQANGMGTMYENQGKVSKLTTENNGIAKLYAIWKPLDASTTASIFSYGTGLIYVGSAIIVIAIAAVVIYSFRKKKSENKTSE